MKMYILVKNTIPLGIAINSVGHASLTCYKTFEATDDMQEWYKYHWKKVTCIVTEEEFEDAKKFDDRVIITESSMDNAEICMAFKPREEFPERFKYYKLYTNECICKDTDSIYESYICGYCGGNIDVD